MAVRGIEQGVYFVTGAGQGIGRAVAAMLAGNGGAVAIADMNGEAAEAAAAEIAAAGGRARGYRLDVRDRTACFDTVERAEADLGPLTGAVAAAGIARTARAETMDEATFRDVMETNVNGVFFTCQACGTGMLKRGRGSIVAIGSATGFGGQPGRANYAASKWAVAGMVKTLAIEWGMRGVRVNAVAPNVVDTPMVARGVPEQFVEHVVRERTPLGRIATPNDIAEAIVFLLSDHAAYVTGTVLPVDGGLSTGFLTARSGRDFGTRLHIPDE